MTDTASTERVSDERLAEMLAGLEGVTPGPWDCFAGNSDGRGLVRLETGNAHPVEAGKVIATMVRGKVSERTGEHLMRCDPNTMRSILTELQSLRSAARAGTEAAREAVKAILDSELSDTYSCTRVWAAWGYGTMTEDDFDPAAERSGEIADAVLAALAAVPETEGVGEPVAVRAKVISALYGDGVDPGHPLVDMVDALISLARVSFTSPQPAAVSVADGWLEDATRSLVAMIDEWYGSWYSAWSGQHIPAAIVAERLSRFQPSSMVERDRARLIHILVVHFDMFRAKAEEVADLFLHDKTLTTEPSHEGEAK